MPKKILLLIFVLTNYAAFSQSKEEDEDIIGTKTLAFGATTSNFTGLIGGLVARSSTPISITKNHKTVYRYIALEILHLKNPRETSQYTGFGPKYTYGKRNYFFSLRPQYGREYELFRKSDDSNVGMSFIIAAGPSIGFLKPYTVKYEDTNNFIQYDPEIKKNLTGVGGMFKNGFKWMKVSPGLHAKVAANLDFNTFGDSVTGIEIGSTVETFFKKPEILSTTFSDNPQTFVSVYLTLYFGSKKAASKKNSKDGSK